MSNDYGFILDGMRWSFSSVSTFQTCPLCFKFTYIDAEERIGNFYSDFGLLVHDVLEKFFNGKIQIYEMLEYYEEHYKDFVVSQPPTYPPGMGEKYYEAGVEYFSNFDFDLSLYDVIGVEETILSEYDGIKLTTKPDLILREKATGKYSLIDFKTAKYKPKGKKRTEQLRDYMNQFQLYVYFYWLEKNIMIDNIEIWFIRDNEKVIVEVDSSKIAETMEWFTGTIKDIKNEIEWNPNISSKNKYFCHQICSLRNKCPYNV